MSPTLEQAASLARPPVDLRHLTSGPPTSQGPRPLCLPFAVSLAHEITRASSSGDLPLAVAPEALWRQSCLSGAAGPQGTSLTATSAAVEQSGQTTEAVWPYNHALRHLTEEVPTTARSSSWFHAASVEIPLRHDGVEDFIEDALAVALPVVLILEVTTEFENPDHEGEIGTPPLTASAGSYHGVAAVGASTSADGLHRRLMIQNSWGPHWGAGGYGWLPLTYLESFAVQAAVLDTSSLSATAPPNLPKETTALWI